MFNHWVELGVEDSIIIYGSTVTVKSVTLQRAIPWILPVFTGMVKSVFLLLDGARILSVSEFSGDSVNSTMLDGEVSYGKLSV